MKPQVPDGFFTISAVEKLTGVNKITIRAWETRHGFITPKRTETGRRLYTQDDIDRINLAVQLKEQGVAISRVKGVIDDSHLVQVNHVKDGEWDFYRQQMLDAIVAFDEGILDTTYAKALSLFPLDLVTKELMIPVLYALGERWANTLGGVAEEHFFSMFMRNKLGGRLNMKQAEPAESHVLVAACLPGEMHELGLLVFAHAAKAKGCRIVLLGSNVPVEDIQSVAERVSCDGIVISCSIREFTKNSQSDLSKLCQTTDVPVWVGGKGSIAYQNDIKSCGANIIGENPFTAFDIIKNGVGEMVQGETV